MALACDKYLPSPFRSHLTTSKLTPCFSAEDTASGSSEEVSRKTRSLSWPLTFQCPGEQSMVKPCSCAMTDYHGSTDATSPPPAETWHPLRFDHGHPDYASYLTSSGAEDTLDCQRNDQAWIHMLLPSVYHGKEIQDPRYGGLIGDLGIFLALVAFSMEPKHLQQWLPWMFQNSAWQTHSLGHGRKLAF